MVETQAHPELGGERLSLAAALEALRRAVDAPLKIAMGDFAATLYMESYRAWRRQELREALGSPYFARIDFVPNDRGQVESYYLGKTYFAEGSVEVTGWQAPIASLFYRSTTARSSYVAPMGEIAGTVHLKRRFVIEDGELRHIADDMDERPLTAGAGAGSATEQRAAAGGRDALLRQVLSGHASHWLRDIIVTLQGDQYALITAPADQVLLIQGVAGSGKTSIALHRLSYLVYPSLVAAKLPPRCIVFGPNRLFLKYVSAVLPKLGLHHVVQTTIAEWAIERLGLKGSRVTDLTFEALLSPVAPPAEKALLERRSRLKTSARMATLLERYVEWRRGQVDIPDDGWLFELVVEKFPGSLEQQRLRRQLGAVELRAAHVKHTERLFALHRAMFTESVLTMVTSLFDPAQNPADAEARDALGRKRLEQASELRAEVGRLQAKLDSASRPSREGPVRQSLLNPSFSLPSRGFPAATPKRDSFGGRREPVTSGGGGAGRAPLSSRDEVQLRQTIKSIEQAAQRRQEEGEALVTEAQAERATSLAPEIREQALKGARAGVRRLVDHYWPPVDPVREYYALLRDGVLLRQMGGGVFSEDELDVIAGSPHRDGKRVDASDLPALHYLCILTQAPDDMGAVNHDYVVVDEAQDLSELDLLCLRALERKRSFTFLGDLSQSIYAHRGLASWDQVRRTFEDRPVTYEECPVSYRTTAEITDVANRVLRSLGASLDVSPGPGSAWPAGIGDPTGTAGSSRVAPRVAEAFDRHGDAPVLTQVDSEETLLERVVSAVEQVVAQGHRSVAVITKTVERARALHGELVATLPAATLIATPEFEYEGGVVVLPVALAKGLEFDAAVVVDADGVTYSESAFDGRLLYVALTRSLHALYVIWRGSLTRHLAV